MYSCAKQDINGLLSINMGMSILVILVDTCRSTNGHMVIGMALESTQVHKPFTRKWTAQLKACPHRIWPSLTVELCRNLHRMDVVDNPVSEIGTTLQTLNAEVDFTIQGILVPSLPKWQLKYYWYCKSRAYDIILWLSDVNTSPLNYDRSHEKYPPGTGEWFWEETRSRESWKKAGSVWLHRICKAQDNFWSGLSTTGHRRAVQEAVKSGACAVTWVWSEFISILPATNISQPAATLHFCLSVQRSLLSFGITWKRQRSILWAPYPLRNPSIYNMFLYPTLVCFEFQFWDDASNLSTARVTGASEA